MGEGGAGERGAPGASGRPLARIPRRAGRAGSGARCVGRARAGCSPWGVGRTGARNREPPPGPARLAPQLLRWHLQDCGGLGGPRRCGAGRGRGPQQLTPPSARGAACSTPSAAGFQHQTECLIFFFTVEENKFFFFPPEVERFLQITQLVKRKQPTSVRGSKAFSAHSQGNLVKVLKKVAIKGRVAKFLSAQVHSCSPRPHAAFSLKMTGVSTSKLPSDLSSFRQ